MKTSILALLLILFAVPRVSLAAAETVSTSLTSIEEGKWRVGGGFNLSLSDRNGLGFAINPSTEYFITDDFSLGGSGSVRFHGDCCSSWSIGPSATYYFWKKGRLAAFVAQGFNFSQYNYGEGAFAHSTFDSTTRLGLEYFLSQGVSFSPTLQFRHAFGTPVGIPKNEGSVMGQFAIYF